MRYFIARIEHAKETLGEKPHIQVRIHDTDGGNWDWYGWKMYEDERISFNIATDGITNQMYTSEAKAREKLEELDPDKGYHVIGFDEEAFDLSIGNELDVIGKETARQIIFDIEESPDVITFKYSSEGSVPSHVGTVTYDGKEWSVDGEPMDDVVGKPSHYQLEDGTEVLDHIFAVLGKERFEGYALGNAIKYIGRAGKKDEKVQDLRKAQEYLGYQISVEENGHPKHK